MGEASIKRWTSGARRYARGVAGGLEREFKLRLPSEEALVALREALGGSAAAPVLQVNHFFDTPARDLGRARIGLRLREERGLATLALKGPSQAAHGALATRAEEELALAPDAARDLLAGTRCPLAWLCASALASAPLVMRAAAAAGGTPTHRLGSFENERQRVGPVRFPPGADGTPLVFELDRTRFPGGLVERELELELPPGLATDGIERALAALFARLGLPMESAPSKAARFLRRLDSAPTPGGGAGAGG